MSASRLDAVYRSFLITKFFTKGWGKPENLRRLFEFRKSVSTRDECFKLIEPDYPVTITKEETAGDCRLLEGHFLTPLERHLPGIVPPAAQRAHFQVLLPLRWPQPGCRPVCLHLAGTGDHYFWRRRNLMAKPLLKEAGIGAIILENPFYGMRKPSDQVRSSLHNVSDIFVMGGCLMLESLVLFHWCERNHLGPLGVTGLSMGGHMASLAATNWPKPLVLVPCLSWSTASAVFLQGVMSQSINWDLLEDQYFSDGVYREKLSKMVTVVDEAFLAGKKFVRNLSRSMNTPKGLTQVENAKTSDNGSSDVAKFEKMITKPENETVDDVKSIRNTNNPKVNSTSDDAKSENLIDNKENGATVDAKSKMENSSKMAEDFCEELTKLFQAGKIRESLLVKLSSNEKFELDARDVEELNKLNKQEILARANHQNSTGSLTNSKTYSTSSKLVENFSKKDATRGKHQNGDPTAEHFDSIESTKLNIASKLGMNPSKIDLNSIKQEMNRTKLDANTEKSSDSKLGPKGPEKKSRNISKMTSDLLGSLPFMSKPNSRKIDISKMHWRDREALQFMRGIMDECTHLSNFSVPFDTSLIIAVCAKHDAYVPREDVGALEEIWPGAEVRYVDAGHVSAYLLHQSMFRSCIIEAFERSKKRWKDGRHVA